MRSHLSWLLKNQGIPPSFFFFFVQMLKVYLFKFAVVRITWTHRRQYQECTHLTVSRNLSTAYFLDDVDVLSRMLKRKMNTGDEMTDFDEIQTLDKNIQHLIFLQRLTLINSISCQITCLESQPLSLLTKNVTCKEEHLMLLRTCPWFHIIFS